MGTINYGSNKIIGSIGYCDSFCDLEKLKDYYMSEEAAAEMGLDHPFDESEALEQARMELDFMQDDAYIELKAMLEKENFYFYDIEIEPGYYDGFYISIEDKYYYLENYQEKLKMQKELTTISKFLQKAIKECNMRICYPGWCTGWEEEEENSLKKLAMGIRAERERIKKIPTEYAIEHLMSKEEAKNYYPWL